jgi:hypothetical protein
VSCNLFCCAGGFKAVLPQRLSQRLHTLSHTHTHTHTHIHIHIHIYTGTHTHTQARTHTHTHIHMHTHTHTYTHSHTHTRTELGHAFKSLDADGNGELSWEEFVAMVEVKR